jgi:hypothetical protein
MLFRSRELRHRRCGAAPVMVIISQEKSTNGNVKSKKLYKPKQN